MSYLAVKMLSNWKTIPVILVHPPLEFVFLLLCTLFWLLDWSITPLGDNVQQNMVNMFYVTLQFPHCQSVLLLYLSYCSARLTAHDRCSSRVAADMCDYTDAHANTCIYFTQAKCTYTCSYCILGDTAINRLRYKHFNMLWFCHWRGSATLFFVKLGHFQIEVIIFLWTDVLLWGKLGKSRQE